MLLGRGCSFDAPPPAFVSEGADFEKMHGPDLGPEQLRDETGLEAGLRLAQTSASRRLCTWFALR